MTDRDVASGRTAGDTAAVAADLTAAILSVGTEVVTGDQVDTNAAWLARRMRTLGARPVLTVAVGDGHDELVDTLGMVAERADVVVVGGGLGPTSDDRTRAAVATFAGVELVRHDDLVDEIARRFVAAGHDMPATNQRQADIPSGAHPLAPVGTAPGFTLALDEVVVHALPGVPWELQAIFDRDVAPSVLAAAGGRVHVTRVVHTSGIGESTLAERLAEVEEAAEADGVEVAYLATGHGVQVKLSGTGGEEQATVARVARWTDRVVGVLGPAVVGLDDDGLEAGVVRALAAAGRTVAVAESATGGMVLTRLTAVPGASRVVRGGMVVYATDTKVDLAGIPSQVLVDHPPVSEPVTRALAEATRDRLGADIGVATTGVAGPDSQDGVPVGTIVWALADDDGATTWSRHVNGDRDLVRTRLATAAIDAVRRHLAATTATGGS